MKCEPHTSLLQIRMTPMGLGLPSPATMLFKCPVRGIMPIISTLLMDINNDEEHYEVLVNRQIKMIKITVLPKIMYLFLQGLL